MSIHVMSIHVMSIHVMSIHVMSIHVNSCHVNSCHVMPCQFMSCHVMSCQQYVINLVGRNTLKFAHWFSRGILIWMILPLSPLYSSQTLLRINVFNKLTIIIHAHDRPLLWVFDKFKDFKVELLFLCR